MVYDIFSLFIYFWQGKGVVSKAIAAVRFERNCFKKLERQKLQEFSRKFLKIVKSVSKFQTPDILITRKVTRFENQPGFSSTFENLIKKVSLCRKQIFR